MNMKTIFQIVIFIFVNFIGFLCISLAFHMAQQKGLFGDTIDQTEVSHFFTNALFAWGAGAIVSTSFFVIEGPLRYLTLMASKIAVLLYWLKFVFLSG